jgi:hypothetical protein
MSLTVCTDRAGALQANGCRRQGRSQRQVCIRQCIYETLASYDFSANFLSAEIRFGGLPKRFPSTPAERLQ